MACTCMNDDGTKRQECLGTCNKDKIVMNEQSISLFQLSSYFDERISKLGEQIQRNFDAGVKRAYREGFLDGFNEGYDKGL